MPEHREPPPLSLAGRTIALPETRQLEVLAGLLERRGARVLRCPLVAIRDTPDTEPVLAWLRRFIEQPPDDFIMLTGEGVRRLLGFADRAGLRAELVAALGATRKIVRGPKPGRALREVGLAADLPGDQPTTEGIIAALDKEQMEGRRVAVQLYGSDPNLLLTDYLRSRGIVPDCVAPYVYAPHGEELLVVELIDALAAARVDVIAFTSLQQYRRMKAVAGKRGVEDRLAEGLRRCRIAAVGPVVADDLRAHGVRVDAVPESSWFMKPLVSEIERLMRLEGARRSESEDS